MVRSKVLRLVALGNCESHLTSGAASGLDMGSWDTYFQIAGRFWRMMDRGAKFVRKELPPGSSSKLNGSPFLEAWVQYTRNEILNLRPHKRCIAESTSSAMELALVEDIHLECSKVLDPVLQGAVSKLAKSSRTPSLRPTRQCNHQWSAAPEDMTWSWTGSSRRASRRS